MKNRIYDLESVGVTTVCRGFDKNGEYLGLVQKTLAGYSDPGFTEPYPHTDKLHSVSKVKYWHPATVIRFATLEEMVTSGEYTGICTECGELREGCEPDAEGYECFECGEDSVEGAVNILARWV